MPIKQVVCSVCKQTVNKAATYHIGGTDRACKTHTDVIAKKAELDLAKAKKAAEQTRRVERPQGRPVWEPDGATKPKCWVCMNTGLKAQEFFTRVLVEMAKMEKIHGGPVNPFAPENQIRLGVRCIFTLEKAKCAAALPYVREDFKTLIDMGGFLAICGDCCHTFKIAALPAADLGQMAKAGVAYQIFGKPIVDAVASMELARDN